MRSVPRIQLALGRLQEPSHVLAAEAVSYAAELLDAVGGAAQLLDDGFDDGVDGRDFGHRLLHPFHDVEVGVVEGSGGAVEEVGDAHEVAVLGELVGDAGWVVRGARWERREERAAYSWTLMKSMPMMSGGC